MRTVHTYVLRVTAPASYAAEGSSVNVITPEDKMVAHILAGRVLGDAEDVINDALPEGWSARIEEWDT